MPFRVATLGRRVPCTIARVRVSRVALGCGSQPSLARRVRKASAMVVRRPLFVGTTRQVSFTDHLAFSGPETDQRGLTTVCEMVRKRDQSASRASQTRDPGPATLADRPLSETGATERPWHARRPLGRPAREGCARTYFTQYHFANSAGPTDERGVCEKIISFGRFSHPSLSHPSL